MMIPTVIYIDIMIPSLGSIESTSTELVPMDSHNLLPLESQF